MCPLLTPAAILLVTPGGFLVKLLILRHCHQEKTDPIIAELVEMAFIQERNACTGYKDIMRMIP